MKKPVALPTDTLHTPEDVMDFLDRYIVYGCIHSDGTRYVDSLGGHDFAEKYRTLSLEDSLAQQIGACIEQTNITKYLLDCMGIKNRVFCTRGYNEEYSKPETPYLVHCFTLAYVGNEVLNIEHSDSELKGIYRFPDEETAIAATHKLFSDKFMRHGATETTLTEYFDFIPGGLTFLGFNQYIGEKHP